MEATYNYMAEIFRLSLGATRNFRELPFRDRPKRGASDAPGAYLTRLSGPKQGERAGFDPLWARVSGTLRTFRTVSPRNRVNKGEKKGRRGYARPKRLNEL